MRRESGEGVSASIAVEELPETGYAEWDALVAASPDGSVYATAGYLDVLCRTGGGSFRILAARKGQELVGGIPLFERRVRQGRFVAPRLLLYYLGPVLRRFPTKYPSQQTAHELQVLAALAESVTASGYAKVSLRLRHTIADVRPFQNLGFRCVPSYSYVVPLTDLPAQWGRVEQNLRRLVERCGNDGIVFGEDGAFDEFLRLHHLTMAHHDAAVYLPDAAFRNWFELLRLSGLCRLYHAALPTGEVIAAQLVLLGAHPVCHTVSAATDPAHRRLGASAFLRWKTFEALARAGKTHTDLTDASLNPVTHFKSQLGGDLVLNPVVESPGTRLWRIATKGESVYHGLRARVGSMIRKGLARGNRES